MPREKRWERLLDQLREELERLEGELDDAADLAAEQEREIVRLGEEVERLTEMLEDRDIGDPAKDDDC
jgi:chromosome segregation ATPase